MGKNAGANGHKARPLAGYPAIAPTKRLGKSKKQAKAKVTRGRK